MFEQSVTAVDVCPVTGMVGVGLESGDICVCEGAEEKDRVVGCVVGSVNTVQWRPGGRGQLAAAGEDGSVVIVEMRE